MKTYIENLQEVIRNLHGVEAEHAGSEEIEERAGGKVVWSGVVDIFKLHDHASATHCFAWEETCGPNNEDLRYVALLSSPTLRTARQAVQKMLEIDRQRQAAPQPKMTSRRDKKV